MAQMLRENRIALFAVELNEPRTSSGECKLAIVKISKVKDVQHV